MEGSGGQKETEQESARGIGTRSDEIHPEAQKAAQLLNKARKP